MQPPPPPIPPLLVAPPPPAPPQKFENGTALLTRTVKENVPGVLVEKLNFTDGELLRLVRLPLPVDFSWPNQVCVPRSDGAVAPSEAVHAPPEMAP
jgi:hypothetical protein